MKDLEKACNCTIRWNSRSLGCFGAPDDWAEWPHEWQLSRGLGELRDFLHNTGNASAEPWQRRQDVVLVGMFDDQMTLEEWGLVAQLVGNATAVFGGDPANPNGTAAHSALFTQLDKQRLFPDSYPSPAQLLAAGKRIVLTSGADYGAVRFAALAGARGARRPRSAAARAGDVPLDLAQARVRGVDGV